MDNTSQTPRSFSLQWAPALAIVGCLALVPIIATMTEQPFMVKVFLRVAIFAIAAVSLNILLNYAGLISFMHGAMMGLGGYTVAILAFHENVPLNIGPLEIWGTSELLISIPIVIIVSMIASFIFGLISLRTSGAYFIMITLAFNQMIFYFFVALQQYGSEDGLQVNTVLRFAGLTADKRIPLYYVTLAVLLFVMLFGGRLIESRFGQVIRAANENDCRLLSVGIAPLIYRLAVFTISGIIASIAGVLLLISQMFISPGDLSWIKSADIIIMAIMGGLATVWGPAIGAAVFLLLILFLSSWTTHWSLIFGIIVIILVSYLKGGLADLFRPMASLFRGKSNG